MPCGRPVITGAGGLTLTGEEKKMKLLSDLIKAKAKSLMGWISPPCGITLTDSQTCKNLRDSLDITRGEYDEILQFLIDEELIEFRQVFRSVGGFLTDKGREMCDTET